MPVRCAIYARYSSDQQRPESIADQVRHCRQEAVRHPEWIVLDEHVYADEAVSGATVSGRAGLTRLVGAALSTPRPFDFVLVDDTSRLARDVVDSIRQFRELRFHGVDLYFVNQGLHSGRDNAEFLLAIYGAMDSEYIRELGRKTHRGLEGQALKGFSAGGIAFGYRREPVYDGARDSDRLRPRAGVRWVVEPAEAAIVREIFQSYAFGRSLAAIAADLNTRRVPCPRQAKGHRLRRDGVGTGWDVSSVRAILGNELYRGRSIWNRSRWLRVPGSYRRRRVLRPQAEWVVCERPDLRLIDDSPWERVQARRAQVQSHVPFPREFGRAKAEYGRYLLSGLLVCGACGAPLCIRTGSSFRGDQRYGCPQRWRRGPAVCSNSVHVRRDLAEARIVESLRAKLYTEDAVDRLVQKVNARLRAASPAAEAERGRLADSLARTRAQLERLRHFILGGDTSDKVRSWLAEVEQKERQFETALAALERGADRQPLQVHPQRVRPALDDLRGTLAKNLTRARELLRAGVQRIVIHPVRPETGKPFARAEIITTGKGLLERVVHVVAGAGFEPATFGL